MLGIHATANNSKFFSLVTYQRFSTLTHSFYNLMKTIWAACLPYLILYKIHLHLALQYAVRLGTSPQ